MSEPMWGRRKPSTMSEASRRAAAIHQERVERARLRVVVRGVTEDVSVATIEPTDE